jgi:hypothetical protein
LDHGDLEHRTLDEMFGLLSALAGGTAPVGVTPQIGSAVLQVADALAFSAE